MDQDRRDASFPWWTPLVLMAVAPFVLWLGFSVGQQILGVGPALTQETVRTPAADSETGSANSEGDGKDAGGQIKIPDKLAKWGVPDLAIVFTGQTFGYLGPCGCSSPQYGGLVRRYNVVKAMERAGWKVAGVDLGEIYPPKADLAEQAQLKFTTTLKALSHMNYQDFGLGESEMKMPLLQGLVLADNLGLKKPRPLSLDLQDPTNILQKLSVRSYDVITEGPAKTVSVGIASMAGPSLQQKFKNDPFVKFFPNGAMIPLLLNEFKKNKVDVAILLVHGDIQGNPPPVNADVQAIAKLVDAERAKDPTLPAVDLIIYTSNLDVPPARPAPIQGASARELFMGHKGKEIGVLGMFRKPGGGFRLEYDLVELGPKYDTPAGAKNPVMDLYQDYADEVKKKDFLAAYSALRDSHPLQRTMAQAFPGVDVRYAGDLVCKKCHLNAWNKWKATPHSRAFAALEDAAKENPPFGRQFDPECVVCHTVGFKYQTGYFDPPPGGNLKNHNLMLENVSCESCHGPASMHAADPKNKAYYKLINPIKGIGQKGNEAIDLKLNFFCQGCHDLENDVHWGKDRPFLKSWARIEHPGPANDPPKDGK